MFKKMTVLVLWVSLIALTATAQEVPVEIDDPDGDWDDVIEQLDESGYIDEKAGELVNEENRIRFESDDDIFLLLEFEEITDFVLAAKLEMEPYDSDEDFQFCGISFRDVLEEGFIGLGLDNFASVILFDQVFDNDDFGVVGEEEHGEDVDDEVHIIIIALDDELTVYANGELIFEEDDLSVRAGLIGLLRTEGTDCEADDYWLWAIENDSERTFSNASEDSPALPDEIDDYDGASADVIDQFEDAAVIARGSSFLFGEDFAFIGASGSTFFPLGRGRNRMDVVIGGELTFDAQSDDYEGCGLLLRLDDSRDPVEEFLFVGIGSENDLFIQNGSVRNEPTIDFFDLDIDLDDPHHLIMLARGDKLAVYLDGELVVQNYPIYEVRGIFGIGLTSDSIESTCEARDIWVYDTPFFEIGVCNVIASGNVNRRSGPSTGDAVAGQLSSGETLQIESQTEPGDGFIWYELEDGSYIREDIISLVGDCSNISEK